MRKLSLNILLLIFAFVAVGQENPHGEQLQMDCIDCHTTEGWEFVISGKFDHNKTQFTLEGQHEVTECAACHTSLVFSEAKTSCIACHTDMHNTTVGMDCARCHDSKSWIVSNITELHQFGRFPLLGAHNTADCNECHLSASRLEFEPVGVECIDCHRQDYLAATNPNHSQAGFSTDCIECHKIEAHEWSATGINHDFFPLTLGHEINECAACHTSGITEPLSTDCYSCHQTQFNATTNPNHISIGISVNCEDCHTIGPGWNPALFPNHNEYYALNGAHATVANECYLCHSGNYNNTANSCYACHTNDYNNTNNPNHVTAQFSTDCQSCHSEDVWSPSTFDHDNQYFPIYSGKHREEWNSCTDCHTQPNNYSVFSCTVCHEHNQTEMDKDHSEVQDYVYNSVSCLACHPSGDSNDD